MFYHRLFLSASDEHSSSYPLTAPRIHTHNTSHSHWLLSEQHHSRDGSFFVLITSVPLAIKLTASHIPIHSTSHSHSYHLAFPLTAPRTPHSHSQHLAFPLAATYIPNDSTSSTHSWHLTFPLTAPSVPTHGTSPALPGVYRMSTDVMSTKKLPSLEWCCSDKSQTENIVLDGMIIICVLVSANTQPMSAKYCLCSDGFINVSSSLPSQLWFCSRHIAYKSSLTLNLLIYIILVGRRIGNFNDQILFHTRCTCKLHMKNYMYVCFVSLIFL